MTPRSPLAGRLPAFPWDAIADARRRAGTHPDGIVDLSVGTPVDPTPDVVRAALADASDASGYPAVAGTADLRSAIRGYLTRRWSSTALDDAGVLATIGSKELISCLPIQLGLGAEDTVVIPELAYPTYEAGARAAGCSVVAADSTLAIGPRRAALLWLNSPSNPTGRVLPVDHLRKVVEWARERGVIVAADECYLEFGWDGDPVSVLDPRVNGGSLDGILAVHSLSKRSNMAGYRAGYVAGDPALVSELLEVRRHLGLMVGAPVQRAMIAALGDDEHVRVQRARYLARRSILRDALVSAGFRIDHSEATLYLWATRDEPCADTVAALAEIGILVAPGTMYGPRGARHVRVALTATDERVAAAAQRLSQISAR